MYNYKSFKSLKGQLKVVFVWLKKKFGGEEFCGHSRGYVTWSSLVLEVIFISLVASKWYFTHIENIKGILIILEV